MWLYLWDFCFFVFRGYCEELCDFVDFIRCLLLRFWKSFEVGGMFLDVMEVVVVWYELV